MFSQGGEWVTQRVPGAAVTDLTFIPTWRSNNNSSKVWYEITYEFRNFNGCSRWILEMEK